MVYGTGGGGTARRQQLDAGAKARRATHVVATGRRTAVTGGAAAPLPVARAAPQLGGQHGDR